MIILCATASCANPGEVCRFEPYHTSAAQSLRDLDTPEMNAAIAAARPGEPR